QSSQVPGTSTGKPMKRSSFRRHVPVFRYFHHSGSVGAAALTATSTAIPETSGIGLSSTNDRMARSEPVLLLHANVLFAVPPSSKQLSQRMFTPGGVVAAWAVAASAVVSKMGMQIERSMGCLLIDDHEDRRTARRVSVIGTAISPP